MLRETNDSISELTHQVIGCAIEVHSALGPGLLESTYEACLEYELKGKGLRVERQLALPVLYKKVKLDLGYRIDMLVEQALILELKAVQKIEPIHESQLLSYLKLSKLKYGLILNFNVKQLKEGIKRMIL